jgi:hypothetical protein
MSREQGGLFHFLQTSKASTPSSTSALQCTVYDPTTAFVSSSIKTVKADVWHFRLGHLPQFKLSLLHDVLPFTICTVCPLAHQRRLSFISTSVSSSIFYLIHVDIWGPFSVQSINGSSYFLTIVDDFSCFT